MFSRIGAAAYKEDLHNTLALCQALDNPHTKFKSIHIAGTNGKGSTSHMLAAILQQAGYKTGLYTSPHLHDFRERIRINGEMIPEDTVVDFVQRTMGICSQIEPSFFELTVAMAFDYFQQEQVDVAVIETGLGGRLDSTNVITPILSVITNIGYDHMNLLGDTLEKITAEKAGIIKPGVPVVIGEYLDITKPIFLQKATETGAPIIFAQDEYQVNRLQYAMQSLEVDIHHLPNNITETFTLDLNGLYQAKNLCTVLCAEAELIKLGFKINEVAEKFALSHSKKLTGLGGRWELIKESPAIVLDVAHNENGIREILQQLEYCGNGKVHFVMGMVNDKDISKVLSLLPTTANYYFTNAHIPRALPFPELVEQATAKGLKGTGFADVNEAIAAALKQAAPEDLIMVCGSVFIVGEVNRALFS